MCLGMVILKLQNKKKTIINNIIVCQNETPPRPPPPLMTKIRGDQALCLHCALKTTFFVYSVKERMGPMEQ